MIAQNFLFLRIFNDLVDFSATRPHGGFRRLAPRLAPSCFHSASTGERGRIWKQIEHRYGIAAHDETDQARRRCRRDKESRAFHLGRRTPRLRAACAAERPQEICRAIPRRPSVAPHQPRAQHRAHLRAGAQPGDHHHRRDQEWRGSGRQARCRPARHHGQGTRRPLRQGAHRAPAETEHGQGLPAHAGARDHSGARATIA